MFVPLALVFIIDGQRGVRQTWPAAVVCGVAFGVAQFVTSNYVSVQLTDIVASLLGAGASSCCCASGTRPRRYVETAEEAPVGAPPATRAVGAAADRHGVA